MVIQVFGLSHGLRNKTRFGGEMSNIGTAKSKFLLNTKKFGVLACGLFVLSIGQGAQAETISEVVAKAISTHPKVAAAKAAERAAQEDIKDSKSGFLPTVSFTGDAGHEYANNSTTRSRSSRSGDEKSGVNTVRKSGELSVTQMLFDGFNTRNLVGAAKVRSEASRYDVLDAQDTIALRAVQAYLTVARNAQVLKLSKENLEKHEEVLRNIQVKAESGSGNRGDENQAASRLALAQARLAQVQGDFRESQIEFMEVVGEMPGELDYPEKLIDFPASQDDVVTMAIDGNPSLKSSSKNFDAKTFEAKATKSSFLPTLDFELTENRTWDTGGVFGPSIDRKAVVVLKYDFYEGGSSKAKRQKAIELAAEAKQKELETRLQIEKQARLDYNAYLTATSRFEALKKRAVSSAAAVEAYQRQFKVNRRTLLDVLDVENELYQAKVEMVDGDLQSLFAQYRVLATAGQLVSTVAQAN